MKRVLFFLALFHSAPLFAETTKEEKPEGFDWIAFPIFEGNSDAGFVFGAQASFIDYGEGVDPFIWELLLKSSYSTKNRHDHRVVFDAPKLIADDLALFSQIEFVHIQDANWFGAGTETLTDDASYTYELTEPALEASLARTSDVGVYYGAGAKLHFSIVEADDDSFFTQDRPLGDDGERNLIGVLFGGFIQTDDPFSPRNGVGLDIYVKGTAAPLSTFSWGGFGFSAVGYKSLIWDDLVFAQRVVTESLHGDVPVSRMTRIGGARTYRGLGGVFSQRGFPENRFAGTTKFLSNTELRYYFPELFGNLVFGLAAFSDIAKVVAPVETSFRPTFGGELSIAWKGAFLFRIDYGVGDEGGEFYIEGRHLF